MLSLRRLRAELGWREWLRGWHDALHWERGCGARVRLLVLPGAAGAKDVCTLKPVKSSLAGSNRCAATSAQLAFCIAKCGLLHCTVCHVAVQLH